MSNTGGYLPKLRVKIANLKFTTLIECWQYNGGIQGHRAGFVFPIDTDGYYTQQQNGGAPKYKGREPVARWAKMGFGNT